MTRTGRSEKLTKRLDGPFVRLHPQAAKDAGLDDGDLARVVSARGSYTARAEVTDEMVPGTVFAPFHWGDLWTSGGGVNETTHGAACPVSKQPELKGAAVRVVPAGETPPARDRAAG